MTATTTLEDAKRWLAHLHASGADLFCEATRPAVTPLDLLEADHMMKHEVTFWEGVQRSMDELAGKAAALPRGGGRLRCGRAKRFPGGGAARSSLGVYA